ncbi:MAG: flagellin N-terminal helical domain-containing protein [Alphaproteobacteria bacterium]
MAEITLSSAVRNNLLSLQNTAALLGKTQQRLATGLKVNSALDDPTAFFTASSLSSRAGDLNRLLDSVANGIQTIKAADTGISALTDLVESAQASARQALQATGPVTKAEAIGAATATFNPQAVTSVTGTASSLTADASGTFQTTANLGTDAANAVATGTDLGDSTDLLSAQGIASGDTLIITDGATALTVTFDASSTATITGGGSGLTIGIDQTLAAFATGANGLTGIGVTDTAGVIAITGSTGEDTVRVQDGAQGTNTAELGFGAVGAGADTTNRVVSKNTALEGLIANARTLTVQRGTDTAAVLTFGTAAGNIQTKADLLAQLGTANGFDSVASGTNQITINNADLTDYSNNFTFNASNADVFTAVGLTADSGQTTLQTVQPNNLLTQSGGLTAGQTLTLKFGSQSNTITFGSGTGQVDSLGSLNTKLNSITGGAASVATTGGTLGRISLSTTNVADSIVVGGTSTAVAEFGLTAGEYSNLVNGTSGPVQQGDTLNVQVGANSTLTVTFGTGTNQVNTLAELKSSISGLVGGTATIDDNTGAITINSTIGTDNIVITEGNAREAGAFGLAQQTYASVTTNSLERASQEAQFNEIRTQIDALARDASFNGNNLLQSNNLKVIFNEDNTSFLTIKGVDFDTGGLGINAAALDSFQTDTAINVSLKELDSAIASLRTQSSTFGSSLSTVETRKSFTNELVNVLETGAGNLTLADSNLEGANVLALQTRQQLASVALSLASQADQAVLRLF